MTKTMLMVHGAFVGSWVWEPLLAHYNVRGWTCLNPDLRHHQKDADHAQLQNVSLRDYLDDLIALIQTLQEPPIVIGHSMGGLLAQQLAARGLARAIILLAPAPPWGVFPSSMVEIMGRLWLGREGPFWQKALPPRYDMAATAALDRFEETESRRIYSRFVPESGRALFEILYWPLDLKHAAAVSATQVQCPVFIGVGEQDQIIVPATARSIARKYPGRTTYVEFPDHSHYLLGEPGFEKILPILDAWLDQLPTLPNKAAA